MNKEYPDFITNTGYGTGGGLCGWNCRHNFTAFDPEHMENNLEKYGLKENERAYNIKQGQRKLERRIRNTKKIINATKSFFSTHNIEDYSSLNKFLINKNNLLKKQMKDYNIFCQQNNVKQDKSRLFIYKLDF